jgi:Cu/Ag efflux pump CusA
MIHQVTALSLKFRVLVVGVAAVVMALGAAQLPGAPVAALPEFGPPVVQIQTEALGLSAPEVEQLITVPMEQTLLNGIPWLDQIRSESAPGLSSIDLIFEPDTNPLKARQVVQERMTRVRALPNVGSPPVIIQPLSSTSRVMMIGLSSHELSLIDMSVLARWKIKPRLMGVPGVSNVTIWGERNRQLQVQVDPERLHQNGVTLNQVIFTTGNALWVSPLTFVRSSTPGTGGFIDTANQRFTIQHILPIRTASELSSVIVEGTDGRTVRLDQVATVVEDHQPLIGDAVLSTGPGLMLVVQKLPEANTLEVAKRVREALNEMRPGLAGVEMDTTVYQSDAYVQAGLNNLGRLGLAALLLVFVLLGLVLSWRMALISMVTIVLSLVAAAYVLYVSGVTFNMMALVGLVVALGVVIGDSLVDLGNIRGALRAHRSSGDTTSTVTVVAEASRAMRGPLVYATLIILVAAVPLLLVDGVAGSFLKPAVLAYFLAVAASTVVAWTVTPALAFMLLKNEPPTERVPIGRWFLRLFETAVPPFLRRPGWANATVVALLVMASAAIPQLGGLSLSPSPQDRTLLIKLDTAPGTSLGEMDRVTTTLISELRLVPGVRLVGAHVGRAVTGDQVVNVNSGEAWASLFESADYDATIAGIERVLRGHSEFRSELLTYSQDRVRAAEAGANDALVVRIYGRDLDLLRTEAEKMRQLISTVPGVSRPRVDSQAVEPSIEVKVNLAAAQHYGLNPGDVRRAAATYYAGLLVGNLYEDQKVFEVVVRGSPSKLSTPNVGDLMIDTPSGAQVRLGDLASVQMVSSPTVIKHDATSRSIDVTAEVSGRDLGSVLADVNDRVKGVKMPLEYHAEVRSDVAAQQSRNLGTAGLAIAGAIAIFLLLQAAFSSWRLASLVFLTVPLGAAGGVLAAFPVGGITTLGALAGLFIVLAVAVRNAVLVARNLQESIEGTGDRSELVIRATRESAVPVLITTGATSVALLPLLVLGAGAGTEVLYPLAAVVVGGLVTSTAVTLFVMPALMLQIMPAGPSDLPSIQPVEGTEIRRTRDSLLRPVNRGTPAQNPQGS